MADGGACNGDHAGVRLPLITDRTMLSVPVHAFQDLGNAKFMRNIWQLHDALAVDGDNSSTSGAGVFHTNCLYPPAPRHLAFILARRLCADTGGGSASERFSMSYSYRHSLDSVTEMRWDDVY